MEALYSVNIPTKHGSKTISVFASDILTFDSQIDILTTSAFFRSYRPIPGTLFNALDKINISVYNLSKDPEIDLRNPCNVWLSKPLTASNAHIKRVGCVEMKYEMHNMGGLRFNKVNEHDMIKSIKAYFQMLDIAATYGIKMDSVAIPVLGSGQQRISAELILIPLINECVQFLKRCSEVKKVFFIERNQDKAYRIAQTLANSYSIKNECVETATCNSSQRQTKPLAFISYSSSDRNVADNLCAKLEAKGVQVWYAPRNVRGDYATSIAEAIVRATHFIVILSKNSMASEHVLNEIDLAFKRLPHNIRFNPLRIDEQDIAPAFNYYLSRQHWMDAHIPPIEQRLIEFVDYLLEDL